MKVWKQYSNDDLKEALSGSKEVIQEAEELLLERMDDNAIPWDCKSYDMDDQQITIFNRYKQLPQFERDLLFLTSKYPISKVAELYGVTSSYIYIKIKKIHNKLNEHTSR